LKARLSWLFALLKMGGITIDSALQVGFMLWALQAGYQAVVQGFCLGRHSLTIAHLQTVVDQCILYDKDPWCGPVSCNGKLVCAPLATVAAVPTDKDSSNPYKVLSSKPYNYHLNSWQKSLIDKRANFSYYHNSAIVIPTPKAEIAQF
jgi:hypothetical protein